MRLRSLILTTVLVSQWQPQDNCWIHWGQKKKASKQFACKCCRLRGLQKIPEATRIPSYPSTEAPACPQGYGHIMQWNNSSTLHILLSSLSRLDILVVSYQETSVPNRNGSVEEIWWNSSITQKFVFQSPYHKTFGLANAITSNKC